MVIPNFTWPQAVVVSVGVIAYVLLMGLLFDAIKINIGGKK